MIYIRKINTTYTLYGPIPVTQCAAVSTYWSPISAPPHAHCSLLLPRLVKPIRASHGYFPMGGSDPPTILRPTFATPQNEANPWIVLIFSKSEKLLIIKWQLGYNDFMIFFMMRKIYYEPNHDWHHQIFLLNHFSLLLHQ